MLNNVEKYPNLKFRLEFSRSLNANIVQGNLKFRKNKDQKTFTHVVLLYFSFNAI
jgi:hypothetical protein